MNKLIGLVVTLVLTPIIQCQYPNSWNQTNSTNRNILRVHPAPVKGQPCLRYFVIHTDPLAKVTIQKCNNKYQSCEKNTKTYIADKYGFIKKTKIYNLNVGKHYFKIKAINQQKTNMEEDIEIRINNKQCK